MEDHALGPDFWSAFASAVIFCGAVLVLSMNLSGRLLGKTFTNLSLATQKLWHCHMYCLLPGAIIALLTLCDFFTLPTNVLLWEPDLVLHTPASPELLRACGFSIGFLSFDLLIILLWREELLAAQKLGTFVTMLLHHLLSIFVWVQCIPKGYGVGIVRYLLLTEASSLFLNLRWLLLRARQDCTLLINVVGVCLLVSFAIIRILPVPWYLWVFYSAKKSSYTMYEWVWAHVSVPIPPILNIYWFFLMIKTAVKTFGPNGSDTIVGRKVAAD